MYNKEEIKEDLNRVHRLIEALELKYGEDMACMLSLGIKIDDDWAGGVQVSGEPVVIHQNAHAFLNSPKFIHTIIDAMSCVLAHQDRPEQFKEVRKLLLKSVERDLISETDAYKEERMNQDIESAVDDLINQVFGKKLYD